MAQSSKRAEHAIASRDKSQAEKRAQKKAPNQTLLAKTDGQGSGSQKRTGTSTKMAKTASAELGRLVRAHVQGGRSKDIPFLLPMIRKKSQVVEIRMTSNYNNVTTSSGVAYTSSLALTLSNFIDSADVIDLFDEYRPIRGKAYYIPRYIYGGNSASAALLNTGGACIDFANASSFASATTMLNHDNHVMFDLFRTTSPPTNRGRFSNSTATWQIIPDATPDENWVDCNASTAICWWKPYFQPGDITASLTVGYVLFDMVFQFRGLK